MRYASVAESSDVEGVSIKKNNRRSLKSEINTEIYVSEGRLMWLSVFL